jgi:hypothetical protein
MIFRSSHEIWISITGINDTFEEIKQGGAFIE